MPTKAIRAVLSVAPVVAVILDRHNVVRFCNSAAEKLNGVPAAAIVGQKVDDLFPTGEPHRAPLIWAARRGENPCPTLYEGRTISGRACWLEMTASALARGGSVLVWARDRSAAVELARTKAMLAAAFDRPNPKPTDLDRRVGPLVLDGLSFADICRAVQASPFAVAESIGRIARMDFTQRLAPG